MASSPYRFTIQTDRPEEGTPRSRVGLSSISSGGGGSAGGEGYRASALRPGSSGWMAATFGGAPQTDYVRPTTTATMTATPTATQTAAPTLAPTYGPPAGDQNWNGSHGEGAGAGSGNTGSPTGFDAGGHPGVGPDIEIGGREIGRALGGIAGGFLGGPLGALAGGFLGGKVGGSFDTPTPQDVEPGINPNPDPGFNGDGTPNAATQAGLDAEAAANIAGGVALANGGWFHGKKGAAMNGPRKGLVQVGGRSMGGFAMGGSVPCYADGGEVDGAGLAGPNPPGPDDGYAALDGGEYVVRAQQAQRPDYASVLQQINQGTYDPDAAAEGEGTGGGMTPGRMPAEGGSVNADASSLPPMLQQALGQAVAADPMVAQALSTLLGPEAVHELMECCGGAGMGEDMAEGENDGAHETPFGRPPLAGPQPPPGINAPPGVRPPAAATPTMQMPQPMGPPGLRGVMA